jgi:hypothetical protein
MDKARLAGWVLAMAGWLGLAYLKWPQEFLPMLVLGTLLISVALQVIVPVVAWSVQAVRQTRHRPHWAGAPLRKIDSGAFAPRS